MQFTVTYKGQMRTVQLALLADGYFPAAEAAVLVTVLAPLRPSPERALELGLEPGTVLYGALYPQDGDDEETAAGREVLLNTILSQCLRREARPRTHTSWYEYPREETEAIVRAAVAVLDAEDEEILRMSDFYATDEDDDEAAQPRQYLFRSEADKVHWRFVHATASITEAARASHEFSRHAVERHLILKGLAGRKSDGEDEQW